MKRFKDLLISCSKDQAQAFFSRLTSYLSSSCPDGWQIDDDRMKRFADGICFVSGLFSCVVRFDGNKNPYAMVSLVYSEDEHRIWISNIVPCQTSQLSMDEYNEVLVEFASEIVDPVKLDLTCVITKDEFTGKDVMPEASWQKLESFDALANRTSLHPNDVQRWHQFVISIFHSGIKLYSDTVIRILCEEFGWDREHAIKLAMRYDDELDLLREYVNG